MQVVTIVVVFPERSHLELQDPGCPGIPWRLWVWKELLPPWRAPGIKTVPIPWGQRFPGADEWCSVSIKIHLDLWPISALCCAFAPPASQCPQLLSEFQPNNFLPKSTLWNISKPGKTSLDLQSCSAPAAPISGFTKPGTAAPPSHSWVAQKANFLYFRLLK